MENVTIFFKTPSNNIDLVNLSRIKTNYEYKNKMLNGVLGNQKEKHISFILPFKSIHTNKIYIDFENYIEPRDNNKYFTLSILDYFILDNVNEVIYKEQAIINKLQVYTIVNIQVINNNPNNNYLRIEGI